MTVRWIPVVVALALVPTPLLFPRGAGALQVFSAAGAVATDLEVTAYRLALGEPNNGNAPGPLVGGRREINWDGGGNPNGSPGGTPFEVFSNRGAIFTTPGTGFQQAPAGTGTGNLEEVFGNLTYGETFSFFSPVRLFTPQGSNITVGDFSVPGSDGALDAGVLGFGAVFSDVDLADTTTIDFFNTRGGLITSLSVPPADQSLSFLGILLDPGEGPIGSIRITTGTTALGPNDDPANGVDVVVMDDFFFAEPQQVAQPSALALVGVGLLLVGAMAWRRRIG
jgi:hypothetical protein